MTRVSGIGPALAGAVLGVALAFGACAGEGVQPPRPEPIPEPEPTAEPDAGPAAPRLPATDGPFWPSMAQVRGDVDMELLSDVEACADCHADVAAQWRSSAHARSSFDNPWYRVAVDSIREEAGPTASRFCAGCHDPLLLVSGAIDEPQIAPDDPLAHAGITCMVCHSVVAATPDGNASWTLETTPVPIPQRGDPASIEAHRDRMATDPLRTAQLCGTCHRGFLTEANGNPHFLPGMDDLGPWRASAHAGTQSSRIDEPMPERRCQDCHMSDESAPLGDMAATAGEIASHRFPGAQTALAALGGDETSALAIAHLLEGAATIDVAAIRFADGRLALPADGAEVGPGDEIAIDVVVRNVGAGHRFPGGVRDTQDTWIELSITTRDGRVIAEAGTRHAEAEDDTAHRLMTVMLDGEGHPELRHFVQRFHGKGYDHTIAPRDASVTRYAVTLPTRLPPSAMPLRIEARLSHRRHVRPMHDAACAASRDARGRAFAAESRALGRAPLSACTPQPITPLAAATVLVGAGGDADAPRAGSPQARPSWQRLYEHALGLTHQVQERTDEARPSLERALSLLGDATDEGSVRARAMVLHALARVEARQGRLDDALEAADQAEAALGAHPALDMVRGDAYAQVWRWPEAATAYARAVDGAPGDSAAYRAWARALGSTQSDTLALSAAATGLGLAPRDEAMLRTQALALGATDDTRADEARALFLAHRRPDRESDLRLACARGDARCARDQQPVVTIEMRTR